MIRYTSIRFQGERRFPGIGRHTPSFDTSEGYVIERANETDVIVSKGEVAIHMPWSAVLEAIPWVEPAPVVIEEPPPVTVDEQPKKQPKKRKVANASPDIPHTGDQREDPPSNPGRQLQDNGMRGSGHSP